MENNLIYKIFQLDENHLIPIERLKYSDQNRIVLLEANFYSYCSNDAESFQEAIENIKKFGNNYSEYAIIPIVKLTN